MPMNCAGFSYQPNIIERNKQTLAENYQVKGWLSNGFRYNKGGLDELIQTSTIDGNLWTGAVLQNGGHRHGSKFNAASFIGLDIDNEVIKRLTSGRTDRLSTSGASDPQDQAVLDTTPPATRLVVSSA